MSYPKRFTNEEIMERIDHKYGEMFNNPDYLFYEEKVRSGEINSYRALDEIYDLGGIRTERELLTLHRVLMCRGGEVDRISDSYYERRRLRRRLNYHYY